jgi:hypothetical protein
MAGWKKLIRSSQICPKCGVKNVARDVVEFLRDQREAFRDEH